VSAQLEGKMNITLNEIISDLVKQPGLGMFAWFCFITFLIALIFFIWALKSGQLNDLEQSKFDMFDEDKKKEANNNG
jgi:cbb3-type cytochrome oxidase maturation protein